MQDWKRVKDPEYRKLRGMLEKAHDELDRQLDEYEKLAWKYERLREKHGED